MRSPVRPAMSRSSASLRSAFFSAALLLPAAAHSQSSSAGTTITDVRTKRRTSTTNGSMANAPATLSADPCPYTRCITYRPNPNTPTPPDTSTPPTGPGTYLSWSQQATARVEGDGSMAGVAEVQCASYGLSISCSITATGQIATDGSSGRSQARVTVGASNVTGSTSGTVEAGNGYGMRPATSYSSSFPASTLSLVAQGNGVCGTQPDGSTLCAGTMRSSYSLSASLTPNSTAVGTTGTIDITVSLPNLRQTVTVHAVWTVVR